MACTKCPFLINTAKEKSNGKAAAKANPSHEKSLVCGALHGVALR